MPGKKRRGETLGISQAELDKVAQAGLMNAQFEYAEDEGLQVVEEFIPEEKPAVSGNAVDPSNLRSRLAKQ